VPFDAASPSSMFRRSKQMKQPTTSGQLASLRLSPRNASSDDTPSNLETARQLGFHTVLVGDFRVGDDLGSYKVPIP